MLEESNFLLDILEKCNFLVHKMKKINFSLTEAREDYLEAILILSSKSSRVRPIDIAKLKGVSKATVSVTISTLVKMGYVQAENPRSITLTEKGIEVAESVLKKHGLLLGFLTEHLGVSASIAREAACKMEHAIGPLIAEKLAKFILNLRDLKVRGKRRLRFYNLRELGLNTCNRRKRKIFLRKKVR